MSVATTREIIIQKADTLFYEAGFEATSFADIAASVGISRGNFYHHFKTKDHILDAVIARRMDRTRAMLAAWEAGSDGPRARILCFIRMLIANRSSILAHGCPVGTLCTELSKLDHAAQVKSAQILGLFRGWLDAQFRALGAGDRADTLALHLLTWSQGVAVMATALRDEAYILREVAGIEAWLRDQPGPSSANQGDHPCSSPF